MEVPVIMHINCCEQGQTLGYACRKCNELGFDGIEFRRKRNGIEESVVSYLDSISRAVEKYKVENVIFGSPGLQNLEGTDAERESGMEELIKFFELASDRFRLYVCNTFAGLLLDKNVPYSEYTKNGSFIAKEEHWERAVNCFKVLGKLAQKLGFRFALETHMGYLNDTIQSTARLVREIANPAVGINIDYGNLVYFEDVLPIRDTVNFCADRVYYIHLKNSIALCEGGRTAVGLGEGSINNREFLKALKEIKYQGPLCIEVPRRGDREWFIENDLYYLRKLMETI